jgi:hypothetical protein
LILVRNDALQPGVVKVAIPQVSQKMTHVVLLMTRDNFSLSYWNLQKLFKCYISSVQEMRRTGILNRIRRNAWLQDLDDDLEVTPAGTTLDTVTVFHFILAAGLLLSIILLALENMWWRTVQLRNEA